MDDVAKIKSKFNDEDSGVVKSLKYVSEHSECNYADIHCIRYVIKCNLEVKSIYKMQ